MDLHRAKKHGWQGTMGAPVVYVQDTLEQIRQYAYGLDPREIREDDVYGAAIEYEAGRAYEIYQENFECLKELASEKGINEDEEVDAIFHAAALKSEKGFLREWPYDPVKAWGSVEQIMQEMEKHDYTVEELVERYQRYKEDMSELAKQLGQAAIGTHTGRAANEDDIGVFTGRTGRK